LNQKLTKKKHVRILLSMEKSGVDLQKYENIMNLTSLVPREIWEDFMDNYKAYKYMWGR
jgi:hypothetical protein